MAAQRKKTRGKACRKQRGRGLFITPPTRQSAKGRSSPRKKRAVFRPALPSQPPLKDKTKTKTKTGSVPA
jgi:hypothetical protein